MPVLSRTIFPLPAFKVTEVLAPSAVPIISGSISISPLLVLIVRSAASERTISEEAPSTNLIAALAVVNVGSVPVIRNASAV